MDVIGYTFQGGEMNETALAEAMGSLGRFIIATNDLDDSRLLPQAILESDEGQGVSVERGFRYMKDPCSLPIVLYLKNRGG